MSINQSQPRMRLHPILLHSRFHQKPAASPGIRAVRCSRLCGASCRLHAKRAPLLNPAFAQRVPQASCFFPRFSYSQKQRPRLRPPPRPAPRHRPRTAAAHARRRLRARRRRPAPASPARAVGPTFGTRGCCYRWPPPRHNSVPFARVPASLRRALQTASYACRPPHRLRRPGTTSRLSPHHFGGVLRAAFSCF